ncbi:unnamed protein product [Pedinophyceae sp. YPF-701]|nr:unnamed protein product [Pedinophyceae sp. YPF-701]
MSRAAQFLAQDADISARGGLLSVAKDVVTHPYFIGGVAICCIPGIFALVSAAFPFLVVCAGCVFVAKKLKDWGVLVGLEDVRKEVYGNKKKEDAPAADAAAPEAKAGGGNGNAPLVGGAAILAQMKKQRADAAKNRPKEVYFLYGSQTGTAQEIARNAQGEAESRGLPSQVMALDELGFENMSAERTPFVVLVSASTGDGDPPDNCSKFWMAVRRKDNPEGAFKGVKFTSLGLGDSNYTRFMHVPRVLCENMRALGAGEFFPPGEADEVEGLEDAVEGWLEKLWPVLEKAMKDGGGAGARASQESRGAARASAELAGKVLGAEGDTTAWVAPEGVDTAGAPAVGHARIGVKYEEDAAAAERVRGAEARWPGEETHAAGRGAAYSASEPFWAGVADARLLTSPTSDRRVLHVAFDIKGSGMDAAPGSAIAVHPVNCKDLVDGLIARLGLDGGAVISLTDADGKRADGHMLPHIPAPCTVRAALARGVDISSPPRKSLLRLLAEHCEDPAEKRTLLFLCSKAGKEAYKKQTQGDAPTLLDILNRFKSCRPPLAPLLDHLPALAPRQYSLTNSSCTSPDRAEVAMSVVSFQNAYGRQRKGVATTWLDDLCAHLLGGGAAPATPPRIATHIRSGGAFSPPEDLTKPWIMVGPGTGVAPFRGFLQKRRTMLAAKGAAAKAAPAWLFFGCRRAEEDFLYEEDLTSFKADGTLTRLEVAFSRAQKDKVYVQHLMAKHAAEIHEMVFAQGGYVFVCGDGAGMAKDVHATLVAARAQHGACSDAEAAADLQQLTQAGRYVRDIWS